MATRHNLPRPIVAVGVVLGVAAILVYAIYAYLGMSHFEPTTRRYTFTRVLSEDLGQPRAAAEVKSREDPSMSVADVFTDTTRGEYGADTNPPDGVGLVVRFMEKETPTSPAQLIREITIPDWKKRNDGGQSNPARRQQVKDIEVAFHADAEKFLARRNLVFNLGAIIDTTEDVTPVLLAKIRRAFEVGDNVPKIIKAGQLVRLHAEQLTDESYPGSSLHLEMRGKNDLPELVRWLEGNRARPQSSIYAGIASRITEIRKEGVTKVRVWTDGVENTSQLPLYKRPELLDETRDLDKYFEDRFRADVRGLTIHLHPLPTKHGRDRTSNLEAKALEYLGAKLKERGATVVRESS